jgi:uncharacterized membrane protein
MVAMSTGYLWVKAFHIVFVASWFAGLFYLPRILVNLAQVSDASAAERERLLLMGQRLYRFASLLMVPALALGLWLWLGCMPSWWWCWGRSATTTPASRCCARSSSAATGAASAGFASSTKRRC